MNDKRSRSWTLVAAVCIIFCIIAGFISMKMHQNGDMHHRVPDEVHPWSQPPMPSMHATNSPVATPAVAAPAPAPVVATNVSANSTAGGIR